MSWNYGYSPSITRRQVLERFTQEEIMSYIVKDVVDLDRKYCSPFRIDTNPGCHFWWGGETLYFVDFAAYPTHYDCFSLYALTFAIPAECVCEHIWSHCTGFQFGYGPIISSKGHKSLKGPKNTVISILPKEWGADEIKYWDMYGITTSQLDKDKVIPLKAVMIENAEKNCSFVIKKIGFAYTDFDKGHKKIYQPYNKSDKWFTNCNANDIGNINDISDNGYFLIITKSYKDCRVIRNLGFNCIWFQNEGMCPSNDIIKNITDRFERIIVFYDNDRTGIIAGGMISERINNIRNCSKAVNLPEKYLETGIKDSSDLVKAKGYETLRKFIKSKLQK